MDGRILRAVYSRGVADYEAFRDSGALDALVSSGAMVPTREVDAALGGSIPAMLGLGAAALGAYALLFGLLRHSRAKALEKS